jgi:hypothetical protein
MKKQVKTLLIADHNVTLISGLVAKGMGQSAVLTELIEGIPAEVVGLIHFLIQLKPILADSKWLYNHVRIGMFRCWHILFPIPNLIMEKSI